MRAVLTYGESSAARSAAAAAAYQMFEQRRARNKLPSRDSRVAELIVSRREVLVVSRDV